VVGGRRHFLRKALSFGMQRPTALLCDAAGAGDVEAMGILLAADPPCPLAQRVWPRAVVAEPVPTFGGVLEFLRQHDCPGTEVICTVAAQHGHTQTVQWALNHGFRPWIAVMTAVHHFHAATLQCLLDFIQPPGNLPVAYILEQYHATLPHNATVGQRTACCNTFVSSTLAPGSPHVNARAVAWTRLDAALLWQYWPEGL
jgi:hypothetical protein